MVTQTLVRIPAGCQTHQNPCRTSQTHQPPVWLVTPIRILCSVSQTPQNPCRVSQTHQNPLYGKRSMSESPVRLPRLQADRYIMGPTLQYKIIQAIQLVFVWCVPLLFTSETKVHISGHNCRLPTLQLQQHS